MPIDINDINMLLRKDKIKAKKLKRFFELVHWGRNYRDLNLGSLLWKRVHTDQVKGSTPPEADSTHWGALKEPNEEESKLPHTMSYICT